MVAPTELMQACVSIVFKYFFLHSFTAFICFFSIFKQQKNILKNLFKKISLTFAKLPGVVVKYFKFLCQIKQRDNHCLRDDLGHLLKKKREELQKSVSNRTLLSQND